MLIHSTETECNRTVWLPEVGTREQILLLLSFLWKSRLFRFQEEGAVSRASGGLFRVALQLAS